MNPKVLEKKIIPVTLNQRKISPRPGGKMFKEFTVYEITGNDGIKYETPVQKEYEKFKMGVEIDIKYEVITNSSGGKIYTNYRLYAPNAQAKGNEEVMAMLTKVVERIDTWGKNLLAAIEIQKTGVAVKADDVEVDPAQMGLFDGTVEEDGEGIKF